MGPLVFILIILYLMGLIMEIMHRAKPHLWFLSFTFSISLYGRNLAVCRHYVLSCDKYCEVRMGAEGNCSPEILTDGMITTVVYPREASGSSQTDCETKWERGEKRQSKLFCCLSVFWFWSATKKVANYAMLLCGSKMRIFEVPFL